MPVGISEPYLGADPIVCLLPCPDVLVVGIDEAEFLLKHRAYLFKAFPRVKPRLDPREVASVHDQVSNNLVASQEMPGWFVHQSLKVAQDANRAGIRAWSRDAGHATAAYISVMGSPPDFWLIECDTFWLHCPQAIACTIIAGPAEMMLPPGGEQWLVRTDFPVFESDGTMTDRVLVDRHPADFRQGDDWSIPCTGAYCVAPSVLEDQRRFTPGDWVGGHKITVTSSPAMHGVDTSVGR
jgi:hypothetical protein